MQALAGRTAGLLLPALGLPAVRLGLAAIFVRLLSSKLKNAPPKSLQFINAHPLLPTADKKPSKHNIIVRCIKRDAEKELLALEPVLRAGGVLGLDTEWVGQKKTAIIQLACESHCVIVPIGRMRKVPLTLYRLLNDASIIKTGVHISFDSDKLFVDYGIRILGIVDPRAVMALSPLFTAEDLKIFGRGLSALSTNLLGIEHSKSRSTVESDWDKVDLNPSQVRYAASDAWLSREILVELHRIHSARRLALDPSSADLPLSTMVESARDLNTSTVDKVFNARVEKKGDPLAILQRLKNARTPLLVPASVLAGDVERREGAGAPSTSAASSSKHEEAKSRRMEGMARKKDLYENCKLEAPDGQTLCTISRKKADWYISRDLGTLVSSEPYTVRLRFDPKGRGHADDAYYTAEKENKCVICGGGKILRHHVVPSCFRSHFAEEQKSHLSHDILPICSTDCHRKVNQVYSLRMRELGHRFGLPLDAACAKRRADPVMSKAKSAAGALTSKTARKIPQERRTELEAHVRAFLKLDESEELTAEALDRLKRMEVPVDSSLTQEESSWASKIVLAVKEQGGQGAIDAFVRDWRRFFLETMRPKHMPAFWSVEARTQNSSGSAS